MKKVYLNGSLYLKRKPKNNPLAYKGLSNIHQLLISEEGMYLRQRDCTGDYYEDLIPVTIEQIENEYINLLDFLNEAQYIGRRGKMIKESLGGDIQFCMRKPIVLYQGKEHILIYSDIEDFGGLRFGDALPVDTFDYRYVQNWEFFGEQTNIYSTLRFDIIMQYKYHYNLLLINHKLTK